MWHRISEATTRLALRRLFAGYLTVSACALLFPYRSGFWIPIALLHLMGVLLLLPVGPARVLARGWAARWPRAGMILADWYALIIMPFLYVEIRVLNTAVHNGRYFDDLILAWEGGLFGGQPSQELAVTFSALPLSETLHFFYLSYYFIIYLPPLYLYARGRTPDQQRMVFTLMVTFFAHYLFFIFFPVQGPWYLFPPPVGEPSQGPMFHLARAILEGGSSRGAAFPSSHVGVAFTQAAMGFLVLRRAAPLLLLLSTGLAVGAVYSGFHYATDAFAGLLLGLALFAASPHLALAMGRGGKGGVRP